MYYVYILQNSNRKLYIGYSTDLKKRLASHNNKENASTKPFAPYKLIFYEAFLNRLDAKNREEYLKGGYGRKTIMKILKIYLEI